MQLNILKNNVDFLLSNNLDELLKKQNSNSSTIGYNYLHKNKDVFNRNLINKYNELLVNTEFVNGTIFLTKSSTMNKLDKKLSMETIIQNSIFISIIYNLCVLGYILNIERNDCNCFRDWRHNFMKYYSIVLIIWGFLNITFYIGFR